MSSSLTQHATEEEDQRKEGGLLYMNIFGSQVQYILINQTKKVAVVPIELDSESKLNVVNTEYQYVPWSVWSHKPC